MTKQGKEVVYSSTAVIALKLITVVFHLHLTVLVTECFKNQPELKDDDSLPAFPWILFGITEH